MRTCLRSGDWRKGYEKVQGNEFQIFLKYRFRISDFQSYLVFFTNPN
ncbi:MAG: hypothetical protein Ct9H300mP23_03020 [Nitrospinota bacterium]|nr:MAG: hypothetical protein Ct9H300mP23_03020 [Nitrospinota bacterium]